MVTHTDWGSFQDFSRLLLTEGFLVPEVAIVLENGSRDSLLFSMEQLGSTLDNEEVPNFLSHSEVTFYLYKKMEYRPQV